MAHYGFYFDAESCIGCHTCQVACKDTHDLPVGVNRRIVRSFLHGRRIRPEFTMCRFPRQAAIYAQTCEK